MEHSTYTNEHTYSLQYEEGGVGVVIDICTSKGQNNDLAKLLYQRVQCSEKECQPFICLTFFGELTFAANDHLPMYLRYIKELVMYTGKG